MGVLKHDGTVTNLDALSPIYDTNANGFGPEATRNPDMVAGVKAGAPMPWAGGYKQSQDLRGSAAGLPHVKLGRSGSLPAGNATLPGVTTR